MKIRQKLNSLFQAYQPYPIPFIERTRSQKSSASKTLHMVANRLSYNQPQLIYRYKF